MDDYSDSADNCGTDDQTDGGDSEDYDADDDGLSDDGGF